VGLDHAPQLIETANSNVHRSGHSSLLVENRLRFVRGSVLEERGREESQVFDLIHVGCAFEPPPNAHMDRLISLLSADAMMLLPLVDSVSSNSQSLTLVSKANGIVSMTRLDSCSYAIVRSEAPPKGSDSLAAHQTVIQRLEGEMRDLSSLIKAAHHKKKSEASSKISWSQIEKDEELTLLLASFRKLSRSVEARKRLEKDAITPISSTPEKPFDR